MEATFNLGLVLSFGVGFLLLLLAQRIHPKKNTWLLNAKPEDWRYYDMLPRARMAFASLHFMQLFPPLAPFLIVMILAIGLGFYNYYGYRYEAYDTWKAFPSVTGLWLGAQLAYAAAWPIFLRKYLNLYRLVLAQEAAQDLAKYGDKALAMAFFDDATQRVETRLRLAAVMGYAVLGNAECIPKLQRLSQDPDPKVAAEAKPAFEMLQKLHAVGLPLSVAPMDKLVERLVYIRNEIARNSEYKLRVDYDAKLEETVKRMNEIVRSQYPLARAFPFVYCVECLARAEKKSFEYQEWVRCRRCKDVHGLIPDVKVVIGQIGGVSKWEKQEGTLRVSLWDPEKGIAKPAEADWIEIIGGKSIQYDWAVSALVEKYRNQQLDSPINVPVKLIDKPVLDANTMRLLRDLDPNVVAG